MNMASKYLVRGFYPSAESIGEIYGLILFFGIIYYIKNKNNFNKLDFVLYLIYYFGGFTSQITDL